MYGQIEGKKEEEGNLGVVGDSGIFVTDDQCL